MVTFDEYNVYYACTPKHNGEFMYIGFLSKNITPTGQCLPCCFKKDTLESNNKHRIQHFMDCIYKQSESNKTSILSGDILYVLQNTNKLSENRLSILPEQLDLFINYYNGCKKTIDNHYLIHTSEYYFKYGIKYEDNTYLNSIACALNISVDTIIENIINLLKSEKRNMIFTYLNNGDIVNKFKTVDDFATYINDINHITPYTINDIICIPNVLTKNGVNVYTFSNHVNDDYYILCYNAENKQLYTDPKKDNIMLIYDGEFYNPIAKILKTDINNKKIQVSLSFKYSEENNNVIHNCYKYYIKSCCDSIIPLKYSSDTTHSSKETCLLLERLKNDDYKPDAQVIDNLHKCMYIFTKNKTIVPVTRSGIIFNISICSLRNDMLIDSSTMIENLNNLYELSNNELLTKVIGVGYIHKTQHDCTINSLITINGNIVPIKEETMSNTYRIKKKYTLYNTFINNNTDNELSLSHINVNTDERTKFINHYTYKIEGFELFRFIISNYINLPKNNSMKNMLVKNINNDNKLILMQIIYNIVDNRLYEIYTKYNNLYQLKLHTTATLFSVSDSAQIDNYKISNKRTSCNLMLSKNKCEMHKHCCWAHGTCKMSINTTDAIKYVSKIVNELQQNDYKSYEIMHMHGYMVSSIVNYNVFQDHIGQKILKSSNIHLIHMLKNIFGEYISIKISNKRMSEKVDIDEKHTSILKSVGNYYVQSLPQNKLTIFRAYANGYYWIMRNEYDINERNLGYVNEVQNILCEYLNIRVSNWLLDDNNMTYISKIYEHKNKYKCQHIITNTINDFRFDLSNIVLSNIKNNIYYIVILYILSYIFNDIPIIVRDQHMQLYNIKNGEDIEKVESNIIIIFIGGLVDNIPENINVMYNKYI